MILTAKEQWKIDTDNAVYSIIATKEKSYEVISYKNGIVRIYDMVSGRFTDEMDIGTTLSRYLGEDLYGNGYFASERFAVSVDSDMKIIAGIWPKKPMNSIIPRVKISLT